MQLLRFPLDRTGKSPANRVADEAQTLVNRPLRAVVPSYGAYFTESLVIVDTATRLPLTRGVDYYPIEMYYVPTMEYGKEICAAFLITNPAVSNNITFSYQALGGQYGIYKQGVYDAFNAVQIDDRPVTWDEILGKPWYFPPAHHLHDAKDVYGLEDIVAALERLNDGITMGDAPTHQVIIDSLTALQLQITNAIANGKALLNAHLADTGNPHHLTAAQLLVYTIPQIDSIMNNLNAVYQNRDTALNITAYNHGINQSNPHQLTPLQLDAWNKGEFNFLLALTQQALPTGGNGYWEYVYQGTPGDPGVMPPDPPDPSNPPVYPPVTVSWSHTNNTAYAADYSVSALGAGTTGVKNTIYVDGQLISDQVNAQVNDPKCVQGYVRVPINSTITVIVSQYTWTWYQGTWNEGSGNYSGAGWTKGGNDALVPGRLLVYRWRITAS